MTVPPVIPAAAQLAPRPRGRFNAALRGLSLVVVLVLLSVGASWATKANVFAFATGHLSSDAQVARARSSGHDAGYREGHDAGYGEGHGAGYSEGHDAGYSEGQSDAQSQQQDAYNRGEAAGRAAQQADDSQPGSAAYQAGYDAGRSDAASQNVGHDYNDGYNAGVECAIANPDTAYDCTP